METIEYINPKVDRSKWPAGAWDGEPDKKQWKDKATGLPCLANRQPRSGHWCGYVGISKTHPLYGKDYDSCDVDVHYGLTFADKCQEVENECEGVCHKAPAGEDDIWWLGFDFAHCGDASPLDHVYERERGYPFIVGTNETYKTLSVVEAECASLAKQLADYPSNNIRRGKMSKFADKINVLESALSSLADSDIERFAIVACVYESLKIATYRVHAEYHNRAAKQEIDERTVS